MRVLVTPIVCLLLLASSGIVAQDFILQGEYWSCPSDNDSIGFAEWNKRLRAQATALSYTGFTYLGVPLPNDSQQVKFSKLVEVLRNAGIELVADLDVPKEGDIFQPIPQANWLRNDFQIKGFRLQTKGEPDPLVVANFINECHLKNNPPELVFADIPEWQNAGRLANWIAKVTNNLTLEARTNVTMRAYDYVLREALRRACSDQTYDVRQIYSHSLRDATALTGFNVVTLVNGAKFENQNGKTGDWDDPITNSLLAYAYLLTNNQVGLPSVFYGDYFGSADAKALQNDIDQLIRAHQEYIFNATSIEYLNQPNTDRQSIYLSAQEGADASQTIVFQIDGTKTPAGLAAKGRRDVLVAINFSDKPLKLIQEINMSNVRPGDVFTDILKKAWQTFTTVANDSIHNVPNAVYIELPPRSYSIWVQGEAVAVLHSPVALRVEALDTYSEISWDVPPGRDHKGYEVEKSVNGGDFVKIAWIDAVNESNAGASYLYIDEDRLPEEEVAYRIKMVNQKGGFEYTAEEASKSFIQEMKFEITNCEQRGVKAIKVKSNFADQGALTVYNAKGIMVLSQKKAIRRGITNIKLDLSNQPLGVYFVKISTGKNKEWLKKVVNL